MIWVFFAILGTLFWAISNIFDKVLKTNYIRDTKTLTASFGIFSILFTMILFFIIGLPTIPFIYSFSAFISGLLIAFIVLPYLKALSIEEASRVVPLWNLSAIFTLILAIIFLGEILDIFSYLAFASILIGGVLISTKKFSKIFHFSSAVGYMLLSSFIASVSDILAKFAFSINVFWETFLVFHLGMSLSFLVLFLLPKVRLNFKETFTKTRIVWVLLLTGSITAFFGHVLYDNAILLGPITLVSVLGVFQGLFVLVIATFLSIKYPMFIKEAIDAKTISLKIVAIALMAVGLFLLTF
jgi:uncharacterized membrane protein